MRKDVRHYFEHAADWPDEALAALLEQAICEGLYCGKPKSSERPAHLFGRQCERFHSGSLSALAALAGSGLRTAAFLDGPSMTAHLTLLQEAARRHVPMVVHVPVIPDPAPAGWFQVVVTTAQEAIDWTLMAHKISELALVPAVVAFQPSGAEQPGLLHNNDIRQFLGNPEDWIASSTPAQRLLFGKNRRRIPNWYHFDFAALVGAEKDAEAAVLEDAARLRFFERHLPEIASGVAAEFASFSGRTYSAVHTHLMSDAEYVVLVQGPGFRQAVAAADRLRKEKVRAGCLHLNILNPFPEKELTELLSGVKAFTVLEPVGGENKLAARVEALIERVGKRTPYVYSGLGKGHWAEESIYAAFRNMLPDGRRNQSFFLDIPFTKSSSSIPSHEVLLHAISREYPGIEEETLIPVATGKEKPAPAAPSPGLPQAIMRHKDQGPPYSKLSRFFHDTAAFYNQSGHSSGTADPFQALPVVPAETGLFADFSANRNQLPLLSPEKCTGCGACMVHCPHSALPALALRMENLLKAGMDIAAANGAPAASLTPMIKNLAKLAGQEGDLRKALPEAFGKLAAQMKLEGEKLQTAQADLERLMAALDDYQGFPAAAFREGGELFSLLVNPHSCTACGVCVEVCPEDALAMTGQTPDLLETYARRFRLWEQLPDTASDTIERLNRDHDYDPFAALLLSRHFSQAMAGGSATEEGAPAKAIMRLVTATAESAVQPHYLNWISELDQLADSLGQNIHAKLSSALPSDDSAALRKALLEAKGKKVPLDELVGNLGEGNRLQIVDTAMLQRKIQLESNLKDLRWALADGPAGTGRARYGLVICTADLPWLKEYPYQPFSAPVWVCDPQNGMAEVQGLILGQMRNLLDELRLVRRARLEIRDAYRADIHDAQIAALSWDDLDEKERRLLPPTLVVADAQNLSGAGMRQILELLSSGWPVKIALLGDGLTLPGGRASGVEGLLFAAMNLRKPLVFQGNMKARRRFFKGLAAGLQSAGPALFHLLAPKPEQHNIPASRWPELYHIALKSRAFPTVLFEPRPDMAFFSEGFSLKGNPPEELPFSAWLQTQRAWNEQPAGPEVAEAALRPWKTWQELAGIVSAAPANLRAQTEAELKQQYEKEMEALRQQYEEKLQEQEATAMERVKVQLREKLLKLSEG